MEIGASGFDKLDRFGRFDRSDIFFAMDSLKLDKPTAIDIRFLLRLGYKLANGCPMAVMPFSFNFRTLLGAGIRETDKTLGSGNKGFGETTKLLYWLHLSSIILASLVHGHVEPLILNY